MTSHSLRHTAPTSPAPTSPAATSPAARARRRGLIAAFALIPFAAALAGAPARAETLDTPARQALVMDYDTGTVLFEKNADQQMVPSSMSKLMTIYMVFKKLKEGSWKMTDELPVSETAWKKHYKTDESLMFLPVGSRVKIEDLIKGVVIQSGNDACSVLAEGYAGSEEAFAEEETRVAQNELGMRNSSFRNASGVPEPGHLMTARDLALLARHLIHDFPEYYTIFSERSFTFNNIKQDNRNPLLWTTQGADGLKTGHTEAGGFGLTASVKRGDRRVIVVLNGMDKHKERWDESQRITEWAFREFDDYALFKPGDTVADADVWLGDAPSVPLMAGDKLVVTMPRKARHDMKVTAVYDGPIPAPIKKGQKVGKLVIAAPGVPTAELPLVAGADVGKLGFAGRISAAVKYLVWGPKS